MHPSPLLKKKKKSPDLPPPFQGLNYELCLISNLVWSRSVSTLSPDGLRRRTCQVEINPLRLKSIKINRRVHLFSSQSRESVNSWINETAPVFSFQQRNGGPWRLALKRNYNLIDTIN